MLNISFCSTFNLIIWLDIPLVGSVCDHILFQKINYNNIFCFAVFSNRIEKKLVNLSGTVPVTFKGNYYLILIYNFVIVILL